MGNKKTTEDFINQAKKIHGDKYDYSLVEYINNSTKVKIRCIKHDFIFEQQPSVHVTGALSGCPICSKNKKMSNDDFIKRSKEIHGDKYDYSLVNIKNVNTKVIITCPKHGKFEQLPVRHIDYGCTKCNLEENKYNTDDFIKRSKIIHGDKYDYSLVEYINPIKLVKIICIEHNHIFEQTPHNHNNSKNACPICKNNNSILPFSEFIIRSIEKHGDKYDYSLVEYNSLHDKVKIICPIHGGFEQNIQSHTNGCGCKRCDVLSRSKTTDQFIKQSKGIFGDKYDYTKTNYVNSKTFVILTCKEHGDFSINPEKHINIKRECTKCNIENKQYIKFVEKTHKYDNIYDFSLMEYKGMDSAVKITCKNTNNLFYATPKQILNKTTCCCDLCNIPIIKNNMENVSSQNDKTKTLIDKFKMVHGDKYDYSYVKYVNSNTNVNIICYKHGLFKQKPQSHIRGCGCQKCSKNYRYNTEEIVEVFKNTHGDKYDYSLVDYVNTYTNVKIKCIGHGIFEQSPYHHIKGSGCPSCSGTKKYTTESFIESAIKVHGNDRYDYSKVDFVNTTSKVIIICKIHKKEFTQTPKNHLRGVGCKLCKMTHGEAKIKLLLDDNNIKYKMEHSFNGCFDKSLLLFDFYLPDINTCIEFDGIQHYEPIEWFGGMNSYLSSVRRDNIKNQYCLDNNITLIRIKYDENIREKLSFLFE